MTEIDVTTRELDLGDFAVLVREAGRGAGPPILCLHGGPGMDSAYFFPDSDVWGPGLRALAATHHVVAYDQRGCGGSGVPDVEEPLALSHHVDDVERVRAALGLGPPAILAHSFGTVLAVLHALRRPASVDRLILVGGAPSRAFQDGYRLSVAEELPLEAQARLAAIQRDPLTDEAIRERFAIALNLYFHRAPDDERRQWLLDNVRFSARVNRSIARDLDTYDLTPALPHVRAPTLVTYGHGDRIVRPEYQLAFRGRLPQARFVAFLESGHFPFLEEPEPFARVVHYFLRHGPRAGAPSTASGGGSPWSTS